MFFNHSVVSLRRALIALALSACAGLASAAQTFHIELDTTSFGSSLGWIELQFNPGNSGTPLAQADVGGFVGFSHPENALIDGHVSGSLASGFTFSQHHRVELGQTELRSQRRLGPLAQFQDFQRADLVPQRLRRPDHVPLGLAARNRFRIARRIAHVLDGLLARPAFCVHAGVHDEPHRSQHFVVGSIPVSLILL